MRLSIDCDCKVCGYKKTIDANEETSYNCPECGAERGYKYSRTKWLECNCGERVSLEYFTNICSKCGKPYNSFGEELRPIEEWYDPEDYYLG